ncbi:unnamed protein product [Adineta steineri]|uniref:Peptidase S8/S53 domain-containing protein n=1 Tax=Adineta steineri TaxID=433720 RepID=A0A819VA72_9BILA|nr:unnamed protein product [Adineta steineri]
MRQIISSSLFNGASFSVDSQHSIKMIESIPNVIAVYPVYSIPAPDPLKNYIPLERNADDDETHLVISHDLTGVDQVHQEMKVFGNGVRVAVIDTGVDYSHPALGGCFGGQCKVGFGYDFVGNEYSAGNPNPIPDDDPMDNCSQSSHGTHVAGIVAANGTGITQAGFIPFQPFLGVAPQATIGAYRVFGCAGDTTSSDVMTAAIYRAFDDKADIITMSVGSAGAYTERSDMIAAQRVSEQGVYLTFSFGNAGSMGLQTCGSPSISPGAIAVASIDNLHAAQLQLFTPDNETIFYLPGTAFGGWQTTVQSIIIVNGEFFIR